MMNMLISLFVVIISQCTHISKYHVVHPKFIQYLFVIYTSINLREKMNEHVFSMLNWDTDVMVGAGVATFVPDIEVKGDGANPGTLTSGLFCEQEIYFCLFFFFFFVFLPFLGLILWCMQVPRLGVQLEL